MLREINGNLLDFPQNINVIVHQANCQNAFGAGIALQIKKRYPEAYKADSEFYQKHFYAVNSFNTEDCTHEMMGCISAACVHKELERYVVNLYAQNLGSKGRATNYEAFARGLEQLEHFIISNPETIKPIIGFPKGIGCGLGGGSWNVIKAMLQDFQKACGYKVYVVDFSAQITLKKKVS